MRLFLLLCTALLWATASATRLIESKALQMCSKGAGITSTHFSAVYTPNNNSLALSFDLIASISGKVTAEMVLDVYGYEAMRKELDPCQMGLGGLCPLRAGKIPSMTSQIDLPEEVASKIPGIAYTVPDLDAAIRIYINNTESHKNLACIEANLSNGKTVYQPGVGWTTAVITGLGMLISLVSSGLGHSNTATHIATNVLALFGFMQSQALFGMLAVEMPPIVEAWTQNFQWSMGIIHVGFVQTLCTWYQRSTGGKASTILSNLGQTSVHVLKRRSLDLVSRGVDLARRDGSGQTQDVSVAGIERVGFRAGIELTNIFLTGLVFFFAFVIIVMILLGLAKLIMGSMVKSGKIRDDRLREIDWNLTSKGILFRMFLMGFVQMCVLCPWEFTRNDSPAEIVLGVLMLIVTLGSVGYGVFRMVSYARQSIRLHQNPACFLYSNPVCLEKYGILYAQYQATSYYFIIITLVYLFVKSLFIGLAQKAPTVQTIALIIIEAAMLIVSSVLRPWMDKKANACYIAIAAINFLNAIFLLFFDNLFDQPGLVVGVMGVVFFVYSAVFVLVLLIIVLVASIYAIVSKNPDTRYQPMSDKRDSFLKSASHLPMSTELDALGATARGDGKMGLHDDVYTPHDSEHNSSQPAVSQVDLSVPLIPSDTSRGGSPHMGPPSPAMSRGPSPASPGLSADTSPSTYRGANNASPWHRGAGYDH